MWDALRGSSRRSLPVATSGDPLHPHPVLLSWGLPRTGALALCRRDAELDAGACLPLFSAKTTKVWFKSHYRSREGTHTGCTFFPHPWPRPPLSCGASQQD